MVPLPRSVSLGGGGRLQDWISPALNPGYARALRFYPSESGIMAVSEPAAIAGIPMRVSVSAVAMCWLGILSEGYDVGVMGAVLPSLLDDPHWHLTPLQAGALGSYGVLGMLAGGLAIGTLSDLYGRKAMFLLCLTLFSLCMGGAASASTPSWFGIFRFVGGLGLGGIIPIAAALTTEYSPPGRKSLTYGIMYSGYSLGILLAALVAIALLPLTGWRGVVAVGLLPLLLLPLMAWLLPESIEFLLAKRRRDAAAAFAKRLGVAIAAAKTATPAPAVDWKDVLAEVFSRRNAFATACFWIGLFMGLLMVYGLNTWLPQIMRKSGYDLGSSLSFLAVFSLTSAIGGAVIGVIADRLGVRFTLIASYLLGAAGIAALTLKNALAINYALVAVAGFGSVSASLILTSYLANYMAPFARSTGTGWALSFARIGALLGPLLGGAVAGLPFGVAAEFFTFSAAGVIAAVAVWFVPAKRSAARMQDG
jgi:MFS transporter, AAHS family, benzoate transport protein